VGFFGYDCYIHKYTITKPQKTRGYLARADGVRAGETKKNKEKITAADNFTYKEKRGLSSNLFKSSTQRELDYIIYGAEFGLE
jgi:hypothetical protein